MLSQNSSIIIIIVIAFAFYLVYSMNNQKNLSKLNHTHKEKFYSDTHNNVCPKCRRDKQMQHLKNNPYLDQNIFKPPSPTKPIGVNVTVDNNLDPYSDAIKKQDLYTMYDPLTYPQLRLPREVLEKYNEYKDHNGTLPPFNQETQPTFDNPIINGFLVKQVDENEPFGDNIPSTVPLFRVKSTKNTNRYFYYVLDQRYLSKIELKIPLDHVKVNGIRHNNADFYGLPELYDGDVIEGINIYPGAKFKVTLYKTYHFP